MLVTSDETRLSGRLHSIDPESGIHALLTADEVHLIPAATIKSIEAKQLAGDVPTEFTRNAGPIRGVEQEKLLAGLRARLIDFDCCDEGIRIFGGIATVQPPYGPDCVKCTNESVLTKVREVIQEIDEEHYET